MLVLVVLVVLEVFVFVALAAVGTSCPMITSIRARYFGLEAQGVFCGSFKGRFEIAPSVAKGSPWTAPPDVVRWISVKRLDLPDVLRDQLHPPSRRLLCFASPRTQIFSCEEGFPSTVRLSRGQSARACVRSSPTVAPGPKHSWSSPERVVDGRPEWNRPLLRFANLFAIVGP
uniref:Putative secreted protein n=1 Tax=Anopheles darlingi TaxID=43151 RepID=A0A2M4DE44_ANODA